MLAFKWKVRIAIIVIASSILMAFWYASISSAVERERQRQEAASNAARLEHIQEAEDRENAVEALDDDCLALTALGRVCEPAPAD